MNAMVGIEALSYYFPRYSIKAKEYQKAWGYFAGRGIKEKTVAGYDEDEVTMAYQAASNLVRDGELGYVATATLAGPRLSNTLVSAMGAESARKADFTGSTNAVGEALLSCLEFVETKGAKAVLVAADCPVGVPSDRMEHSLGAAAAALLLSSQGGLEISQAGSYTQEELGERYEDDQGRLRGLGVQDVASVVVPQAARQVLPNDPGHVWAACSEFDGRFARSALGALVRPAQIGGNVVELSGDTGCSSALLALMELLSGRKKGDEILLVTYGGGSSVAALFRLRSRPKAATAPRTSLGTSRVYLDYLRYAQMRRFLSREDPPSEISMGAYISVPSYIENIQERYRLLASRCNQCDHIHFPPRPVCLRCGGRTFHREPLSGKGEVYARTVISRGSAPTEFREQQELVGEYGVCLVQLKEGPRIVTQMTDCDPYEVDIGTAVQFVFRRIYRQEGAVRYGYKFRPV